MRRAIAVVGAAALCAGVAVGVPSVGGQAAGATTPTAGVRLGASSVAWHACSDAGLASAGARCATLKVPMDYSKPKGRTISLALSRIVHTSPAADFQGVMLVNPGGPGASGLDLSTLGQYVPGGVGAEYDWIGWDPRGVGASRPALTCKADYLGYNRPNYTPTTAKLLKAWKARAKSYAAACEKARPTLLKHVKTRDSVHDMDSIRQALGASQINYYGFSYGTYLGSAYASLHPTRVRRMVLDGNVDPRGVWYKANLQQDTAFNRNIKIWFSWVAKYHSAYHLGTTEKAVQAQYYKQLKRLDKKAAGGKIGGDEWTDIFLGAGYYQSTWPELAQAFAGWVHHGDWQMLKYEYAATATPGDDNEYAMYTATQCTDAAWPKKWSTWQKDNTRIAKKAKFLTWANAWYNAPCLYWHAKAGKRMKIGSSKVTSALLVNETLDAATPYPGSLELRKLFPHSSLLAEPGGTTHAGSLSGDTCVDGTIARYLATGQRPVRRAGNRSDATCKPLPRPTPQSYAYSSVQPLTTTALPTLAALLPRR